MRIAKEIFNYNSFKLGHFLFVGKVCSKVKKRNITNIIINSKNTPKLVSSQRKLLHKLRGKE